MAYVTQVELERELSADAAGFGVNEADWGALLGDILEDASRTVDGICDQSFKNHDPVPPVVREAVIRLARERLHRIREDGLSSEASPSGEQASYTGPQATLDDIERRLAEAGYLNTDWWVVSV